LEFKLQLAQVTDTLKRELQPGGICRPVGDLDEFGFWYYKDSAPTALRNGGRQMPHGFGKKDECGFLPKAATPGWK
jgi:hypothetical protein